MGTFRIKAGFKLSNIYAYITYFTTLSPQKIKTLKIWIDIIFPALPVSNLYGAVGLFWLDVFTLPLLAIACYWNYLNLYLHLSVILISASCTISCTAPYLLLLLLHTTLKWLFSHNPHTSSHVLDTVNADDQNHSSNNSFLSGLMLWQLILHFVPLNVILYCQSFVSLKLSNIAVCYLWASTPLVHTNTHSYVTTLVFNGSELT